MTSKNINNKKDLLQRRFERFKGNAIKKHGNRYSYIADTYISTSDPMAIICSKHGKFMQKPEVHLMGSGCYYCGIQKIKDDKKLGFAEFKRRSLIAHGDKYDYSLVVYESSNRKVKIKCKLHGVFEQNAHSHMSGIGCRKCQIMNSENGNFSGWGRSKYVNLCDKRHGGRSNLYLIKCDDKIESFYKIGITALTVKKRFYSFGYKINEIYFINGSADFIWDLEWRLKSMLSQHKYKPLKDFGGSSECFSEITKPVQKLLKEISSTNQLQLIT